LWTRTMEYNGIRQKSYTKKKTESTGNWRVGIHQNNRTGLQSVKPRRKLHMAPCTTE
jgi:hypothetical protein